MYEMNYKIKIYDVPNWNGEVDRNFATSRSYGTYFMSEPNNNNGSMVSDLTIRGNMIRMQNKISCITELIKVITRVRVSDKICWSITLENMINEICNKLENNIRKYSKNDPNSIPEQINLINTGSYECGITIVNYVEHDDASDLARYASIDGINCQIGISIYNVDNDDDVVTKEVMSYDLHAKPTDRSIDIGDFSNLERSGQYGDVWNKIGFYCIMTEDSGVSVFKLYRYIYEAVMYAIADEEAVEKYWNLEIEGNRDPIGLFLNMFFGTDSGEERIEKLRDQCYNGIGVFTVRLHECEYAVEIALNFQRPAK